MAIKYAKKAQILFKQKQVHPGIPVLEAAPSAWQASTAYAINDAVTNSGKTYLCITAGTSAGSGGPTTDAADITDGTVHWAKTTSFAATDAVAVFNSDFNTNLSSDIFQYSGSELDRDAGVTITDKFSEASTETFSPALGPLGALPTDATFPLNGLFKSAGAAVTYSNIAGVSMASVTNSAASDDLLTVLISKISPDRPGFQKNYRFYDCRASVDLDIQAGGRAKLKWNFKGNPVDALGQGYPTETALLTPDYLTQKTVIAPSVKLASIKQVQLEAYSSAGVAPTLPAAFAGTVKNLGFSKLSAPNLFGFEYARFLTTREESFTKAAVSSDVTLTVLEEGIYGVGGAVWNPDASVSSGLSGAMLEGYFSFAMYWGTITGQKVYIEFTKLQLMDVKGSDVSGYNAKDLVFKNTGYTTMKFI